MIFSILFERPVLPGAILALGVLFLLYRWANRRDTSSARAVWIGVGLMILAPTVSILVVTVREEIAEACEGLARAVDEGDVAAISEMLAPEFTAGGLDRAVFVERVERALTRFRVDQPRLWGYEIDLSSDGSAVATFSASAQLHGADGVWDRLPTRWKVSFRLEGRSWRAERIESVPVPPLNLRTTDDWLQ